MTDKISVLIITRNREKMLKGCLLSLVAQTRIPNEVIVVDNASDDNTKKVILSFKKRLPIKYVEEKQIGIPYARNRGIKEASGTLILMLDDDCQADKIWVETMIKAHKKYPKAWVIQGRTYSLPRTRMYSLLAEFDRFFYLRSQTTIKQPLSMKNFFGKDFRKETELLSYCDTNNFSIKTIYLKKHKLLFDENFYRGSDTDLGKQILQKNGLIMFCPSIRVDHWERSNLTQFLQQRWHIGRTAARIADKWKTSSFIALNSLLQKPFIFLHFFLFCKVLNQWRKSPILLALLSLDRFFRLSGWFYEKRVLSLGKH